MTAVQPEARFGNLDISENSDVLSFTEKPKSEGGWINGGFFVCEPKMLDYLSSDEGCFLEREPLQRLAKDGELAAYKHYDFWQCMDTLRDNQKLNQMWKEGRARWKVWDE
jgi:glucose-1-phosphate cytidylyltransferase